MGRAVEHDGHEYFLLEDGYNLQTRAVAVLCQPDNPLFTLEQAPATTDIPGRGGWHAVARWTESGTHMANASFSSHAGMVEQLVADHLIQMSRPPPMLWALTREGAFVGSIVPAVPLGVAVHCWDEEDAAQQAADGGGEVVSIDDQARFLHRCVRLGYAGALLNGSAPVFFCIDADGVLQYLRITPGASRDIVMEILDEQDRWDHYEGAEEISFLDNGEACDERLVETLGRRPPLDWPDNGRLISIGPKQGLPAIIESKDAPAPTAVLFTDADQAEEFRDDHDPAWITYVVEDTRDFLGQPALQGCVAQLNPGGHRAHGGTLWKTGDDTVLDAFSGFWKLTGSGLQALD